jgi:hypothetical protein
LSVAGALLFGCSDTTPGASKTGGVDAAGGARGQDLAAGVEDLAAPVDAAAPPVDEAPAPINPVALCAVEPMDQLYSGGLPPNPYAPPPAASACIAAAHDVIIVLGCPNNTDGTPSTCQTKRADLAVAFMRAGFGGLFITSGAAAHNQYVEALTLKQLLVDRGVLPTNVWTDVFAMHTDENIYFSTEIMEAHGWTNAIVISEDPGQLIMTATCDSNCCVALGRLTVLGFSINGGTTAAGHYVRFPWAAPVTAAECQQIEMPLKFMCVNLSSRLACASNLQVGDPPDDAGM